ncbi:MAG: hypothetical protein K2X66_01525 [Cyanobacteria bacterium]|nr:hypothetical protein [Cyanobacteriota bacterium]
MAGSSSLLNSGDKYQNTRASNNTAFGNDSGKTILKGNINYSDEVEQIPDEMFGTWQRTRTLTYSNFPDQYTSLEMGYWTIAEDGNQITLKNPESGAATTIHVASIQGNTVKFKYRSALWDGTPCVEELILSADEDSLVGTQRKVCKAGYNTQYTATARVSGQRLDHGPALSIFKTANAGRP